VSSGAVNQFDGMHIEAPVCRCIINEYNISDGVRSGINLEKYMYKKAPKINLGRFHYSDVLYPNISLPKILREHFHVGVDDND
jgi:hypothetical protein